MPTSVLEKTSELTDTQKRKKIVAFLKAMLHNKVHEQRRIVQAFSNKYPGLKEDLDLLEYALAMHDGESILQELLKV